MKKKKEYEAKLLKDVKINSIDLLEEDNVNKIKGEIFKNISKFETVQSFFEKNDIWLQKLEKIKIKHYSNAVIEILNWISEFRNEWWDEFRESYHYKKLTKILEPYNLPESFKKDLTKRQYKNNPDYFYYKLIYCKSTNYCEEEKNKFAHEYKILLSSYPELNKFINDIVNDMHESDVKMSYNLFDKIKQLELDRVYLYELSLKITDETKYKVIIDGIKADKFELTKLREVKNYLFEIIPEKKSKRSIITQITVHLYNVLEKKYTQSYINTFLIKLKKGDKKIPE